MICSYKGYTGTYYLDKDTKVLTGEILAIRDVVTFERKTVSEVRQAFRNSIDDYLAFCRELGRKAQKP